MAAATTPTCVFTIVSKNYLHYALNLMESVAQHLPAAQRVVVLCDSTEGLEPPPKGIEFLGIEDLGIAQVDRMLFQYTILELNTAIKPFAFRKLFEREALGSIIYFDPDIQLFSSGAPLLARLQQADVVLTPHLGAPLDDDRHPSDLSILQSGTYNLGFLALRRSADARTLLDWWSEKLRRDCVVDIPRGLFTDQKWMDLVPGFFERVCIERHPGWNVAYWNLKHRAVTQDGEGFKVNGEPLFFFHFSGYSIGGRSISKHQDRFDLAQCSAATQQLFAQYVERLDRFGRSRYAAMPYAFARLANGISLPDVARKVLRLELLDQVPLPDLRTPDGAEALCAALLAPVDGLQPPLSRVALQLHRDRADLQSAFPDVRGAHRQAYLSWFAERAPIEAGLPDAWVQPAPGSPAAAPRPAAPAPGRQGATLFRTAYRLAWQSRNLLRPFTTPALRHKVRSYLVGRAFPPTATAPAAAAGAASAVPAGLNLIGYVKAESGVGESARATLRALRAVDFPLAVRNFQAGNVSRMGEQVEESAPGAQPFAASLFHINADQLPLARTVIGEALFQVPRRIGYWAWELENFPAEWCNAFAHVDEVWVPSTFCQQAIAQRAPVPVLVMPHAIEIPAQIRPERARFGLREGSVAFLAMADLLSSAARKNPLGALQAYVKAFEGRQDDVQLVLKVSNGERDPAAMAALRALAARAPGVQLIEGYLDRPSLNGLIESVDCFVSLHRSEGFGLVLAEAMARGKVVLATAWSGNMDFMTAENSLPVRYELVPLHQDEGPYRRGERWAEPDLDDAAAKLRLVAEDSARRQRLGAQARVDCERQLAPAVVGRRMQERLQVLLNLSEGA
ncbi:glycosyltransferase [Inhella sp.]|uniref:glycosyltransferase n=1 Tax=Inhella sp. TaxID=1921806 RepID=UPI0035B0765A